MTYTIVAYQPSQEDSCRSCLSGFRESDFELESYEAEDVLNAARDWLYYERKTAEAAKEDRYLPSVSWELTLLVDGREKECERFNEALAVMRKKEEERIRVEMEEKKREEDRLAAERALEEERKQRESELEMLAMLKKKYE